MSDPVPNPARADARPAARSDAPRVDNRGESDYAGKIRAIAERLASWDGPVVLVAHVDPDGDALGSTLALKRALDALGKATVLPMDPPRFLRFLAGDGELSAPLESLPEGALLAVLDVADRGRAAGAPLAGAAFVVNVDHHGTNDRFGDLSLVEPARAATAQIVKDLIDALGVAWTPEIATPCLTGLITDTGNFRFGNTDRSVLEAAGELIEAGVDYAALTDRLQWRHPDYFRMLGKVMSTVEYPLDGAIALARATLAMREDVGPSEDDSDDFVGLIRYAEGVHAAAMLKEREPGVVKVSVRARAPVSAQAICLELGGGGHVAAAGATLRVGMEEARERLLAACERELRARGLL